MLSEALPALLSLMHWPGPLFLLLGSTLGLLFGILPGLGGPQVLALLLPITYGMDTSQAIVLLIGAMSAVPFGGSITAILINTPGTGCSAATTFDGFPMARQGRAGVALGAAATASCLGGLFGAVILTVLLPVGRRVVLAFSYPEYFMLALMGLSVIAVVSQGSLWKGLISACLGLLVSTIGYDPVTGSVRYTFGSDHLWDGIGLVPAFIGLFAIGEALDLFLGRRTIADTSCVTDTAGVLDGIKAVFQNFGLFLRCSVVGTIVGVIPGVGGAVANFLAYGHAVQVSKNPERFGTGDVRGVIAPEAANNAKDGGALVPTLIFGIPGSIEMAVLLGALVVLGLEPGPRMMIDNPHIVLVLVYTLAAGNVLCAAMGLLAAKQFCRLTSVPTSLLAPVIFTLALMGAYLKDGMISDLVVCVVFGLLAYAMKRFQFSRVAMVIALVLGKLAQKTFHQTLMLWGFSGFFARPISLGLFLLTVAMVSAPYVKARIRRWRERKIGGYFGASEEG